MAVSSLADLKNDHAIYQAGDGRDTERRDLERKGNDFGFDHNEFESLPSWNFHTQFLQGTMCVVCVCNTGIESIQWMKMPDSDLFHQDAYS